MKSVYRAKYVHISNIDELALVLSERDLDLLNNVLRAALSMGIEYDVIKVDTGMHRVSLIECPEFNTVHEPVVGNSHVFDESGFIWTFVGGTRVYHHKWSFVSPKYTGFNYEAEKQRALFLDTLPAVRANKSRIGNRDFWLALLARHNIQA